MSAQTSYALSQAKAYAGLIYAGSPKTVVSRAVETAAGIGFGLVVSQGTNKETQVVLGGTSFFGITVRALDREGVINTGAIKYDQYESAAILRQGYVWAVCPDGCTAGDLVNYVEATGVLGAGAPVGTGESGIDGARWETTAAAGELAVLSIGVFNTVTAGT